MSELTVGFSVMCVLPPGVTLAVSGHRTVHFVATCHQSGQTE
jgi:hypothetical protein